MYISDADKFYCSNIEGILITFVWNLVHLSFCIKMLNDKIERSFMLWQVDNWQAEPTNHKSVNILLLNFVVVDISNYFKTNTFKMKTISVNYEDHDKLYSGLIQQETQECVASGKSQFSNNTLAHPAQIMWTLSISDWHFSLSLRIFVFVPCHQLLKFLLITYATSINAFYVKGTKENQKTWIN